MSFLAPLYVAGLAAVSLPILLHLIRQMPRGRLPFSSLMFLTESPPKITRRSRVDHWLLLLMRAAAVMLVALAFARPFLREAFSLTMVTPPGRHVALLVDTSASMQRGDAWPQARELAEQAAADLDTADQLTLYVFDRQARPLHDPDAPFDATEPSKAGRTRELLETVEPTWFGADLGGALSSVAQQLVERRDRDSSAAPLQMIVVSDLAEGASLDALQTFAWPGDVRVEVKIVRPQPVGNAGLQRIVERLEDDASDEVRVRVSNDLLSPRDHFSLQWFLPSGEAVGSASECYVPAGQSRVFRVRRPVADPVDGPRQDVEGSENAADDVADANQPVSNESAARLADYQLRLLDDPHDYDNVLHFAPFYRRAARIGYLGDDPVDNPAGELFFLQHALGDTARYTTQLTRLTELPTITSSLPSQAIVFLGGPLDESLSEPLREYIHRGGIVWWSLAREQSPDGLRKMFDDPSFQLDEARVGNYLMFTDVNLRHPIFEPFRDPRFADFTTIRFWRARALSWEDESRYAVLARFDNGSPALLEWTHGEGRLFLFASSWRPVDGQLALSTKFVPLVGGLLREAGFRDDVERRVTVGQPLEFEPLEEGSSTLRKPTGETRSLPADVTRFTDTDQPGLYHWTQGDQRWIFAVDLPVAESRTTPLDPNTLEQYGVPLGRQDNIEKQQELQRQMMDQELEGRQQVWRWMLASAFLILVGETWLAGRVARVRRRGTQ